VRTEDKVMKVVYTLYCRRTLVRVAIRRMVKKGKSNEVESKK
jgi:hypothetical protein